MVLCEFTSKSAEAWGSQQLIVRPTSLNVVLRTPWPPTRHAANAAIPISRAALSRLLECTEDPFEIVGGLEAGPHQAREFLSFHLLAKP